FLQKKGWFGVGRDAEWGTGSKQFLRELFTKKHGSYHNFFNDILEPLFYEALRIGQERKQDDYYYSRFNCKIPFLNGGLFDPIGNYDWVHTDIHLPNDLFSNTRKTKEGDEGDGILDVFDRYNFPVREDEPLEKEVAIDPELLGKAYEKFNAIRPDNFVEFTKALKSGKKGEENKFNKKFGVYYTPREIVHYMCKQSLINYLATCAEGAKLKTSISKQDVEDLIEVGEMITEHEATALIKEQNIRNGIQKSSEYTGLLSDGIRQNAKYIDEWLADITVCDPAAGSGAFPVGMMSEIVRTRNVLSVFLKGNTGILACDPDPYSVQITRRNLPHWTKAGAVYWVTFRLADSLPQEKLNDWKAERELWISRHPEPWGDKEWKEYDEQFGKRLEKWLDSGYGSCDLAKPGIRKILQECLLRFNGERLRLHAAVIMPNHVHLLLEPLADNSLPELLKGIKGASSRKINQILETTGTSFWMDESYDHIVRSEAQYHHFIWYITENPVKANLSEDKYWLYHCNPDIPVCERTAKTQTGMSVLRSSYEFKRRCIEHSLYGVDIDPGAVEIAKLRLWLSLVVDEEDIKNIKPLPNLDYKIIQGNSLIELLSTDMSGSTDYNRTKLVQNLKQAKDELFNITNPTRKENKRRAINELIRNLIEHDRRKQIERLKHKITAITSQQKLFEDAKEQKSEKEKVNKIKARISEIANLEFPGPSEHFEWHINFSDIFQEKGGFDVVIANPPYLNFKMYSAKDRSILKSYYNEIFDGKADYYYYFFTKAYQISNANGYVSLITSRYWLEAEFAAKLRRFLSRNTSISEIIDFQNITVFEGIGIKTAVTSYKKQNADKYLFDYRCPKGKNSDLNFYSFLYQKIDSDNIFGDKWRFGDDLFIAILEKIETDTMPLCELANCNQGIVTGLDKAFITTGNEFNNLPKKLVKTWVKVGDIHRYFILPVEERKL
ncbi:MAG: Eco57I restriction-modification methylase domain-containing protein, partial [bacterium]